MARKNKNDNRLLNHLVHLLHVWVFSVVLAFALLFGVFVTTVFDIFSPLLPSLLAVGVFVGLSISTSQNFRILSLGYEAER